MKQILSLRRWFLYLEKVEKTITLPGTYPVKVITIRLYISQARNILIQL